MTQTNLTAYADAFHAGLKAQQAGQARRVPAYVPTVDVNTWLKGWDYGKRITVLKARGLV